MKIPDEAINWTITAVLGAITAWIIRICKSQSALKAGTRAILKDRLLQAFKYHLEQKYIPADDMDNLADMYGAYKGLGGNGAITKQYEEVYQLPTFKKEN